MHRPSKIILITGASRGFGNLTAKLLAEHRPTVYATMRDTTGKKKLHKETQLNWAKSHQAKLSVADSDVTQDKSVEDAKAFILSGTNGSIDVIINNAGIYGDGIQKAFAVDEHLALFEVNVSGTVRINNAFLPTLRKQRSGLIIRTLPYRFANNFRFDGRPKFSQKARTGSRSNCKVGRNAQR
jgi:NADP-dependent 3-hydroxy acid dehydrogenase YdfG